jgi:hypothetical protein
VKISLPFEVPSFVRVHIPLGSEAAFFKESIRRHAIIGRNIVWVLRSKLLDRHWGEEEEGLHSWQKLDLYLNIHTRTR